ncbi:MAG: AAA family ATPase, partial [Oscillospiraceae bacterium]|nr:AAA family ATPase [Oscillospiraceae bacterium]
MEINKLTASFGKLENESLKLHSGLNVIYAPNESGKSTWCAFIQAMLYGIPSSERAKTGYLPDKMRYAPWSGAPMEGSMELTADRKDITITRSTRAKNAPMREFSAVYTGSNVAVEGLTGSNAGEMLTGVSRDVFRRSAFIAQGALSVSGSVELEKRINSIVSTGEESSSYSEAEAKLRSWQRQRRYNRHGLLPELESHMDEAQEKLRQLENAAEETEALEKQLQSLKLECAQLEEAVTDRRKYQRKVALDKLNNSRNNLKLCSEAHDAQMAALSIRREELRNSPFGNMSCEELSDQVEADVKALSVLKRPVKNLKLIIPAFICFVLAAVFAGIFASNRSLFFIIGAAALCIAAVLLFLGYSKAKHSRNLALEQRRLIFKKYKAESLEDIRKVLEKHESLWAAVSQAEQKERIARTEYERAVLLQQELEASAMSELDFSSGNSEAAALGRQLSAK